jgi:hypothetical protein
MGKQVLIDLDLLNEMHDLLTNGINPYCLSDRHFEAYQRISHAVLEKHRRIVRREQYAEMLVDKEFVECQKARNQQTTPTNLRELARKSLGV